MKRVNFLLHNHGPVRQTAPTLEPLLNYFWGALASLGFSVTVSDEKHDPNAVNVYFEYFLDERFLHKLFAFKKHYGLKLGVVATELIIGDDIPYMRDGVLHFSPGDLQKSSGDTAVEASRLRVKNLLTFAPRFDFVWSLLERTQALMSRHNPHSYLFPVGYRPPSRPVAAGAKDIDVLFFGTITPRRAAFLDEIRASGLNVVCAGRNTEMGYVPAFILDTLIDRAKIVLNLTLSEQAETEGVDPKFVSCLRVASALSRGALVVSEIIPEDNPYTPFMVNCERARLPSHCAELVGSGQYAVLATRNFDRFRQEMSAEKVDAAAAEILRRL
jgi:hypothetical protein